MKDADDSLAALAPPRHLPKKEWSAQQHFDYALTGRAPVNPDWAEYRAEVLREHGLLEGDEE
jgi:hypothetical protein